MSFSGKFLGMMMVLCIILFLNSCGAKQNSDVTKAAEATNTPTSNANVSAGATTLPLPIAKDPKPPEVNNIKVNQFEHLNPKIPSDQCKEIDNDNGKKDSLARRLVGYMELQKYEIYKEEGEINIVYIEGACADGNPNKDEPNIYNDRRIIFEFVNGEPKIVGNWLATTEPGDYYIKHPYSPEKGGSALIAFTQHKNAWKVGMHSGPSGGSSIYEGLIEVDNIKIIRDRNKNGYRTGDPEEVGQMEINQHKGSEKSSNKVNRNSAGCLVGKTRKGHEEFMNIVKQDSRFVKDKDFKFTTTVIDGDEFAKKISLD
jgi:hypothetical protein